MADKRVNVALQGGQVFEKYIAKMCRQQREVRFAAMDELYVGFVTGLDNDWVQIVETGEDIKGRDRLVRNLVRLRNVNAVRETGRTIVDLSPQEAERVRAYTGVFTKVANGERAVED